MTFCGPQRHTRRGADCIYHVNIHYICLGAGASRRQAAAGAQPLREHGAVQPLPGAETLIIATIIIIIIMMIIIYLCIYIYIYIYSQCAAEVYERRCSSRQ